MSAAPRPARDVYRELDELRATQSELRQRIAQIESRSRRTGSRDDDDLRVFRALVSAVGVTTFSACSALDYAERVHPALQTALIGADITNARELGWTLRRLEQRGVIDQLMVTRVGNDGRGLRWRIVQP